MFELKKSTKAKLHKTDDKSIKMGQTDTRPAVILNLSVVLPNTALDMFGAGLREMLYGTGSAGAGKGKQVELEGVEPVTDRPSLSMIGSRMRAWSWSEEQSGCTTTVDYGLGDDKANILLKDGTTKDFRVTLQEPGAIKVQFRVHAPVEHLSAEQVGRLHLMHQRDVKVTLVGPKVDQVDIEDGPDDTTGDEPGDTAAVTKPKGRRGGGTVLSPIEALKKSVGQDPGAAVVDEGQVRH